jgi:uncharacterized surface protein with fasciclin (FAS1) repeats
MMMNYSSSAFLALFAFVALAFGPSQTKAACSEAEDGVDDIVTKVCSAENDATFGTLCTLLQETGLDEALLADGDFFVFAPTNSAFTNAGRRAGVTINQKQATLKYHVSPTSAELVCGNSRDSLLLINGVTKQSFTRCDDTTLDGQEGNVRLPTMTTNFPQFTSPTALVGDFIQACNGKIAAIDQVMGFGPQVYDYGLYAPCSFNSRSCKGSKGGLVVATQTVDGVVFNNVYHPKKAKSGRWSNLNQFQSIYANNALDVFAPYLNGYGGNYGYKHGKKSKKGGYYYDGFGRYYNYGGLRGNKHGKNWKRNRNLAAIDAGEFETDRDPSAYEPSEYHYDESEEYDEIEEYDESDEYESEAQ